MRCPVHTWPITISNHDPIQIMIRHKCPVSSDPAPIWQRSMVRFIHVLLCRCVFGGRFGYSGIMKWSHEKVKEFIDFYKQKNILWNPTDPDRFNRSKRNKAWEEIARDTGKSVENCKRKMEYLLSALRREKQKMRKNMKTGIGDEVYQSTWFAFDSLKFLLEKTTSCQTFNIIKSEIIPYEESEERNKETIDDLDQNVEKNTESVSVLSQMPTFSVIPRKRKTAREDSHLDKIFESPKTSSQDIQDDCQHFGNLVAAKLKKFNEDVRTNLESDILELFVKANRGFYDLPFAGNHLQR